MGGSGSFVTCGADHRVVLLLIAVGVLMLILARRTLRPFDSGPGLGRGVLAQDVARTEAKGRPERVERVEGRRQWSPGLARGAPLADDRWVRRTVSLVLVGNALSSWIVGWAQGHPRLPLQLCDLAVLFTAWALLTLEPTVSELAYFWGLGGSLQAVLTPDLQRAFPDYWWLTFFVAHGGVVLGVVYLAITGRVEPTHASVWRVWGWSNLYVLIAGLINWACGINLGYLARKPIHPSLLDHLGPWPYYIVAMEAMGLASFYLYYALFAFARRNVRYQIPFQGI